MERKGPAGTRALAVTFGPRPSAFDATRFGRPLFVAGTAGEGTLGPRSAIVLGDRL